MPRAPRTTWKGSLSFGLVNVPIGVYPATQDKTVHFNQFEEGTSDRIRYRKVNERTGDEVETGRIVRGVDVGGGDYVILSDDELEAAEPEKSRTIEITDFVDLDEIDPIYYRSSYYLAPDGEAAAKAYALLRRAMREANRVGIATMVMRTKEYLVAVRPDEDLLVMETMYFSDEIRPKDDLLEIPSDEHLTEREIDTAKMLIDAMASDWDPDRYADTYRERVQALVRQKLEGKEIVTEAAPPQRAPVVDLIAALNASMERISGAKPAPGGGGGDGNGRSGGQVAGEAPSRSSRRTTKNGSAARRPAAKKGATAKAPAAKRATRKAAPAKKSAAAKATRRKAS